MKMVRLFFRPFNEIINATHKRAWSFERSQRGLHNPLQKSVCKNLKKNRLLLVDFQLRDDKQVEIKNSKVESADVQ